MGQITTWGAAGLLLLAGCAGPRVLTPMAGERPLTPVGEAPLRGPVDEPESVFLLVSDRPQEAFGALAVAYAESAPYRAPVARSPGYEGQAALAVPPPPPPPAWPGVAQAAGAAAPYGVAPRPVESRVPAPVMIQAPAPPSAYAPRLGRACAVEPPPSCDACDKRPCEPQACGGYAGINLSVFPGLGTGVEFGVDWKATQKVTWSWEVGLNYQDLSAIVDTEKFSGKMTQARVGMRWRFQPECRGHLTLRAGLGWFNAGGDPASVDTAEIPSEGDYAGGYVGVGYEWDIGRRWSTGPEASLFAGWNVENGDVAYVPMLLWHFNYKF